MSTFTTDIAKRETLAAMIGKYRQATQKVEEAYAILDVVDPLVKTIIC
jgi:hypothetical protein